MKAQEFFDFQDMGVLGKFLLSLGNGLYPDPREIEIVYTASNGLFVRYEAVEPFHSRIVETGWSYDIGATYSIVTYDKMGGVVKIEQEL